MSDIDDVDDVKYIKIYKYRDDTYKIDEEKVLELLNGNNLGELSQVEIPLANIESILEEHFDSHGISYSILTGEEVSVTHEDIKSHRDRARMEKEEENRAGLTLLILSPIALAILVYVAVLLSDNGFNVLGKIVSVIAISIFVLMVTTGLKLKK